eukprot:351354-Chlamydomonas_euryale.AAC.3
MRQSTKHNAPWIIDGTTESTAPPEPPLNRIANASPAASRTPASESVSAACTVGSTSAMCSASCERE